MLFLLLPSLLALPRMLPLLLWHVVLQPAVLLRLLLLVLLLSVCRDQESSKPSSAKPDWTPLKFLVGQWRGTGAGEPGLGKVERTYEVGVGGAFLVGNNRSVYPPQKANPKGEEHLDHTLIGFDKARQKFVMRQFHKEGFVNQYVLQEVAPDGKKLGWVTEAIENIAPGWRARETYLVKGADEFTEIFELAAPGKDFEVYTRNELKRQ